MFYQRSFIYGLVLLLAVLSLSCFQKIDPEYQAELDAWHAERLTNLTSEDGWLTLIGLHPVQDGDNTIGSGPGMDVLLPENTPDYLGLLRVNTNSIVFKAGTGQLVFIEGERRKEVIKPQVIVSDKDGDPSMLVCGSLRFYVIDRDGQLFLRCKDRESSVRTNFTGIERWQPNEKWRTMARLVTENNPSTITITNALGQDSEVPTPGKLIFTIDETEYQLAPTGNPANGLFIIFSDETSGDASYGGGRFLGTGPVQADGTVVLDFNKAVNPPCVFTPYATCPLPPDENQLALPVKAGEKMWGESH